jgi:hypothetical protein
MKKEGRKEEGRNGSNKKRKERKRKRNEEEYSLLVWRVTRRLVKEKAMKREKKKRRRRRRRNSQVGIEVVSLSLFSIAPSSPHLQSAQEACLQEIRTRCCLLLTLPNPVSNPL